MTQVIINDILPRTQAIATGGQTIFSTTWTADSASDVRAFSRPDDVDADDATQELASNAFSVAFIGLERIVQVTLVTSSTAGDIVTLIRDTPADRENLYTNTNFTPSMLNNDFGILTLVDQQAQLVNQRIGPRYNYSAIISPDMSFPYSDTILPILGPNQTWMKNNDDTEIIAVDFVSPGGNISNWQTIADPSFDAASGDGIVTNRTVTPVQIVLPAVFNVGDEIGIMGLGSGGWTLVCNSGQTIRFCDSVTSTDGSITSETPYSNIFVRGLVANTVWSVEICNSNPILA